jgi:chromosome segregation ATPase
VQLERAKKTIEHLNSSIEETKTRLSAMETAAEEFENEAKMRGVEVQGLRSQLIETQQKASTTAEQLSAAQTSHARESSTQASMILELEERLETNRAELQLQVQKLMETTHSLQTTQKRSTELEENLNGTMGRLQDVEEELSDMKESKQADEQTIHSLKEMFSALRDTQMRSLAELNNKVPY